MVTLDVKLLLPEELLEEAQAANLLNSNAIERLLREELRRRRVDALFAAADRLSELDLPILSDEEIAEEIQLTRNSLTA
jgi:hypothetical protein